VIDGLTALGILTIFFILISGGGTYHLGPELRIRAHHIVNPLVQVYFLMVLRFVISREIPFLGIRALNLVALARRASKACAWLHSRLTRVELSQANRIAIFIIGISVLIKILNAYHYFGFFSGDDVELHEMSFAHLFNWNWRAWELRSPFYPMVFLYPVQAILVSLGGVHGPWTLIFAGRLIVVLFSALNLWLLFKISTRLFHSLPVGLLSVFFLALSKLHTTFASSELPRTVASTFILLGFLALLSEKGQKLCTILSGIALAVGAAVRFSEIIFVVPAFLYLVLKKRWQRGIALGFIFGASFLLIIGLSDLLYWKSAFFSLKNIIDYTLVDKLSSRGYVSVFYYLMSFGLWSDVFGVGLSLYALRLRNQKLYLWFLTPIILLSFLPHKETRYLVPVIPFYAMMAGLAAWHLLEKVLVDSVNFRIPNRVYGLFLLLLVLAFGILLLAHGDHRYTILATPFLAALVALVCWTRRKPRPSLELRNVFARGQSALVFVAAFCVMFILEIGGFRFRRSESAVEMARYLSQQTDIHKAAIEQIWAAGGRLYLGNFTELIDIDADRIRDSRYFYSQVRKDGLEAVGLRAENAERLGYSSLLKSLGFKEVHFSKKKRLDSYRLFLKKENTGPP